jgi:hypothetical protein
MASKKSTSKKSSGWTVEQAVQHLFLKGGEIDPSIAAQLEREAYAGDLHHEVDNRIRLMKGLEPLSDPLSCPVWGDIRCEGRGIPYSLRRGDKWLGAAGGALKEKVSSAAFELWGRAGHPGAPEQKIEVPQLESVSAFDAKHSAALGPQGECIFHSLRIFVRQRKPRLRWRDFYVPAVRVLEKGQKVFASKPLFRGGVQKVMQRLRQDEEVALGLRARDSLINPPSLEQVRKDLDHMHKQGELKYSDFVTQKGLRKGGK